MKVRKWKDPSLQSFSVVDGLPYPQQIREELQGYRNILMGRKHPPQAVDLKSPLALMEVANMYFARACEVEQLILAKQDEGEIPKSGSYQQLRTQEIRSFKELSKSMVDVGSRRMTEQRVLFEQEKLGREAVE